MSPIGMLWLEITGNCQLECPLHCYAESGPLGSHGSMTTRDWCGVIDAASAMGVADVQFIGGEPTMHPAFNGLVSHALAAGLNVEIFSNLYRVRDEWWDLFTHPSVRLATSYYSDRADQHEKITGRKGSHARTRSNIAEAVRRGIPVRAGIIEILSDQRVAEAHAELEGLGVRHIGTDKVRAFGRGTRHAGTPDPAQLCGQCGSSVAAISPDGDVWPCIMSRWMPIGNIRSGGSLAGILTTSLREARQVLFPGRVPQGGDCKPKKEACPPICQPGCSPGAPCGPMCNPNYVG